MKSLCKIEAWGGYAPFKGDVLIDSDWYEALSIDARCRVDAIASDAIDRIQKEIELSQAKETMNPERDALIDSLVELAIDTLGVSYFEVIENEYWHSGSRAAWLSPWVIVHTSKGPIKIGWRKRVIVLDWSESLIKAKAEVLFATEDVTKCDGLMHCWSLEKAKEYLTVLARQETPYRVDSDGA